MLCALLWQAGLPAQSSPPQTANPVPSATVSATGPRIVPPAAGYQFPNGQTYVYGVEWHMFNAGTATLRIEADGPRQKVTGGGDSAGVVNALFKVHDRVQSYFDPRTFCSQQLQKHIEEGSHKRETSVRYDYEQRKSVLDEKNLKTNEQKHEENDIPGCVTDVVSGFYYFSSLPLQAGNVYDFPINDGGKTTEVQAQVDARERIKVPAGTFQTVRLHAEALAGPLKGKGTVTIWLTDDPNHTPVQMRSKAGWGTLMFRLQRIEK